MEDVPRRGTAWFWLSVAWTAATYVVRDVMAAPITMALSAVVGWFAYMLIALIWSAVALLALTIAWVPAYIVANHTGLELLLGVLRLRFEWAPPPASLIHVVELAALLVVAPLQVGRHITDAWGTRAVAFTVMQTLIWAALVISIPFAGADVRVTLAHLPVIMACTLASVVRSRAAHLDLTASSTPA
jgi:hypothetical protein